MLNLANQNKQHARKHPAILQAMTTLPNLIVGGEGGGGV